MKTVRSKRLGKRPRIEKNIPIVKESVEDELPQNSGNMEDQKTYEDYNKEQPLAVDVKDKSSTNRNDKK